MEMYAFFLLARIFKSNFFMEDSFNTVFYWVHFDQFSGCHCWDIVHYLI